MDNRRPGLARLTARWGRPLAASVSLLERSRLYWLLLAVAAVPLAVALVGPLLDGYLASMLGGDYRVVMDAARRWLSGGGFYDPWQFTGPYTREQMPVLYPPTTLVLLVPATVLPAALWWLVPVGLTVLVIARHRPRRIAWAAIVLLMGSVNSVPLVIVGNPVIWTTAAVAAGTVWRWPAALVLLKPSLGPFALVGVRDRRWWLGVALLAVVSAALWPVWADYLAAMRNWRDGGLLYSMLDVPLMLVPVVAWLGRTRPDEALA